MLGKYASQFSPTVLTDNFSTFLVQDFGPIAILSIWTFCLFYVMAELWGKEEGKLKENEEEGIRTWVMLKLLGLGFMERIVFLGELVGLLMNWRLHVEALYAANLSGLQVAKGKFKNDMGKVIHEPIGKLRLFARQIEYAGPRGTFNLFRL